MTEADLIRRARAGDEEAFTRLMEQNQQAVFRLAWLMLGNAHDADDVAQETFIRAYRSLGQFDEVRPLRPWLLSITANLVRNRWRSVSRYLAMVRRATRDYDDDLRREEAATPGEAQALREAVARLDRQDQEVIYLRFYLDMPVDEAAQVLGIAPGTVKSRLHRALGRLRAVVSNDFPQLWKDTGDE